MDYRVFFTFKWLKWVTTMGEVRAGRPKLGHQAISIDKHYPTTHDNRWPEEDEHGEGGEVEEGEGGGVDQHQVLRQHHHTHTQLQYGVL